MSTLSLRKIKHDSSSVDNIVLDSNGQVGINVTPSAPLTIGRVNSDYEGGQIDLCRASDNASAWGVDVYGNTSTPVIRIVDNTASATRLQIDSAGRVTMPYQPAFKAQWASSTFNYGSGETFWDTAIFNIGGHYNTSTGRFTAPVAGVYHFSLTVQHYGASGSVGWQDIRVNGAEINARYEDLNAQSLYNAAGLSVTVYLNEGDYVSCISSAAVWWSDNSSFSGFLVG